MTIRTINLNLDLRLEPVDSSAVAALGYDYSNHVMGVAFHSDPGKVYLYHDVTPPKPAESVGRWYQREVRGIGRASFATLNLPVFVTK